tara:strand:+ start:251 stop:367 length:117 start_codon:yes stop_codon:yes gene_type:complete
MNRKQLKKIRNKKALTKRKNIQRAIRKYQDSPKRDKEE